MDQNDNDKLPNFSRLIHFLVLVLKYCEIYDSRNLKTMKPYKEWTHPTAFPEAVKDVARMMTSSQLYKHESDATAVT